MVTEIELKYSLLENKETTEEVVKEVINNIFSEQSLTFDYQEKQLRNNYFDTAELSLRKSKIALRTRSTKTTDKTECFEQTIKTSGTVIAGLHQRPEYNVDIASDKPILSLFPQSIWREGTDLNKLQQETIELFSTNFTRASWLVTLNNSKIEVAFDSGAIACNGHQDKPRIFEIELELVSGDTQALFVLTKMLFARLSLRPGQLTKAARGYALYHQSISTNNQDVIVENSESKVATDSVNLLECIQLHSGFSPCIEYSLKHLQLAVDRYTLVNSPSSKEKAINTVCELLVLQQQVICHYDGIATSSELSIAKAFYTFSESLKTLNDPTHVDFLNEEKILGLLHSEYFNNLQLSLLITLLKRTNNDVQ